MPKFYLFKMNAKTLIKSKIYFNTKCKTKYVIKIEITFFFIKIVYKKN